MGRTARLAAASPRVGFTALSPGGIHRSVPRVGFTARPAAAGPWVGFTARLVAAGPRLDYTVRSPGWAAPPSGRCRSPVGPYRSVPGRAAPPAGRCRSTVGLYHSVPRVGRTAQLTAAGPWVDSTARLASAGPPGGPHRPAGLCRSPDGTHTPVGRCRSRLGSTARSPVCFAPPGWPLLVPSSPRVGSTTRLAAADPRVGWHAHPV